jgi:hypothetical protein
MLEQSARCSFNQIQHFLKPVDTAVIRIGHFGGIRIGCEFQKQANTITHSGWGTLLEGVEILPIHCEYQVEAAEVLRLHHAGTKRRHVVATAKRSLARACVGGSAYVVSGRAGGFDLEREIGSFTRRNLAKHDFRSGRAADVTEADE